MANNKIDKITIFIYYVVYNNIDAVKQRIVYNGGKPSLVEKMTPAQVIMYLKNGVKEHGEGWIYDLLKGIKHNTNANNFTTNPDFLNTFKQIAVESDPNYNPSAMSTDSTTGLCGSVWTSWLVNCNDTAENHTTVTTTSGIKGYWIYIILLLVGLGFLIYAYRKTA